MQNPLSKSSSGFFLIIFVLLGLQQCFIRKTQAEQTQVCSRFSNWSDSPRNYDYDFLNESNVKTRNSGKTRYINHPELDSTRFSLISERFRDNSKMLRNLRRNSREKFHHERVISRIRENHKDSRGFHGGSSRRNADVRRERWTPEERAPNYRNERNLVDLELRETEDVFKRNAEIRRERSTSDERTYNSRDRVNLRESRMKNREFSRRNAEIRREIQNRRVNERILNRREREERFRLSRNQNQLRERENSRNSEERRENRDSTRTSEEILLRSNERSKESYHDLRELRENQSRSSDVTRQKRNIENGNNNGSLLWFNAIHVALAALVIGQLFTSINKKKFKEETSSLKFLEKMKVF